MKLWKINLLLVVVATLFGLNFVVAKLAFRTIDPRTVALVRVLVGTLFFLPAAILSWPKEKIPRSHWLRLGVGGILGIGLNQLFFVLGLARTTAGHGSIIIAAIPVITLILAVAVRLEKITGAKLIGFVLSFAGILLIVKSNGPAASPDQLIGDLLTICNATSYSIYLILVRPVAHRYSAAWTTWIIFAVSLPFSLAIGFHSALSESWGSLPLSTWAELIYIVVGATLITYALISWLLRYAEPSHVASQIFLQPILAIGAGALLLGEEVTPRILLSAGLVLSGVAIVQLKMIAQRAHKKRTAA